MLLKITQRTSTVFVKVGWNNLELGRFSLTEALSTEANREQDMLEHEISNVLSPRELEMIGYVARGLNFREIGEETGISPRTVQKHIINLLKKMGARNKTHMVAMALAQNLIAPPPVERAVLPPADKDLRIAA